MTGISKLLLYSKTDEIFHPEEYLAQGSRYAEMPREPLIGGHDFFLCDVDATATLIAKFHAEHIEKFDEASERPSLPPHQAELPEPACAEPDVPNLVRFQRLLRYARLHVARAWWVFWHRGGAVTNINAR
jgi:hypothetical protein